MSCAPDSRRYPPITALGSRTRAGGAQAVVELQVAVDVHAVGHQARRRVDDPGGQHGRPAAFRGVLGGVRDGRRHDLGAGEHQVAADAGAREPDPPHAVKVGPVACRPASMLPPTVTPVTSSASPVGELSVGARQVEVARDPRAGQPHLVVGAEPSGVAGALDDDPVGHGARAQPSGRQPKRAADLGVGEVDGAGGVEAVVEEEVGGDAQVARPQARQPRAGQRETGELGHAQVGDVRERALPQLDGHADARAGQPQRAGDRGAPQPQRGRARRCGRGEQRDEFGGGELGAREVGFPARRRARPRDRSRVNG